ncbi:MAG: DNA polymerase III subunit alpha [Patescibacteria group bacterium]
MVHLHVHSHYSLLDGLTKIPDLVAAAKAQGATALALTDHGVMYGIVEFYLECHKQGIKPILGCEIYVAKGKLDDRTFVKGEKGYFHLTLLAKNYQGYLNLLKITTKAHLDGYYYKPRIDHEFLAQHKEGLIAMSGCLAGELPQAILEGRMDEAKKVALWHQEVFGKDYYIELMPHFNLPDQIKANSAMKELAHEINIPLVVTCDAHYLTPEDAEAQDVLLCVQTGSLLSDENRFNMHGDTFDLKSPGVMAEAFADTPEAIANTDKIAELCNVELELGKIILPKFDLPAGLISEQEYLDQLVQRGIQVRFGDRPSQAVLDRIKYELGIINQMHYESYFLVVEDLIRWAKEHGVVVGPGRGSGAASMVSYVLNITDLDPLEYGLFFERFLNPERISMPDFDIDFADDRREEVIRYVVEKHGEARVAQIITFGTMASRAAVRDTGRTLGLVYNDVDRIAKLIPFGLSLTEAMATVGELKKLYDTDPQIKRLIDLSKKLEGVARHTSTHAAGVVIGDKDLVNYTPTQRAVKGEVSLVTQYSMGPIEKLGLLKIDFLGLKNLTIIRNAIRIIRKTRDQEIDITKITFDDPAAYTLLSRGETVGVFQFESEGMRRNLQELKPSALDDLIAMVALYRPGPIELIPDFIDRKRGRKKIEYLHPKLEPILKPTYGIAVYQEQVLQIARDLCGFTLGEADVLRKAIGKKDEVLLMQQQIKFIKGGIDNGIDRKIAEQLFEFVKPFAKYGFNKAHAASYAVIAYWTAYLKVHFPNEFLAALLTSDQGDLDRVAKDIAEAERFSIKVLPPSVNESFTDFAVVKGTGHIRFGLNVIKNVGRKVSELIEDERQRNGAYQDLTNFLTRVPKEAINKKVLESLARVGALDDFGDRKELLNNVDNMVDFVANFHRHRDSNQIGIFGEMTTEAPTFQLKASEQSTERERLAWEKELLGTYVSKHPLKEMMPKLAGKVREIARINNSFDNKKIKVGGIVTSMQKTITRNREPMAFMRLEDLSGSLEVIVFPNLMNNYGHLLTTDKILLIEGKVNVKDRAIEEGDEMIVKSEAKIVADSIVEITDEYLAQMPSLSTESSQIEPSRATVSRWYFSENNLLIKVPIGFNGDKLKSLKTVLERHPGEISVELEVFTNGRQQRLKTTTRTARTPELEKELMSVLAP